MESDRAAPSDACVARILNADGRPEGAGFRIGRREIITCAHVVARALGLPDDTLEPPDGRLSVDFPLADRGTTVHAAIGAWIPPRPDGGGDTAVLTLLADPSDKVPVARLVEDAADHERRVRAFGFPHGYDDGAWSVGWLRGATGAGWLQFDTDPASEHRVEPGFSGGPVWDLAEGGVVGMVVAADARSDVRTGYLIPTRTLRESWSGLPDTALPACPFRSLEPFEERDAALFHGRAEPARRIADLLAHTPATSLVGPSGCGKSSLLYAGVLPRLRPRPELEIVVFRPGRLGRTPLEALALALLPRLEPDLTETARLAELPALTRLLREGSFPAVAERLLARQGKQKLLVVADQFEEALIGTDPAAVDALAAAFAHSLHPGSRVQVLTTLRADFLTAVLAHPGLAPLFSGDRLFTVGVMSDAELRTAVELPLTGTGVSYEPGLVDRILGDVGSDPGRLPLLEFTLTKLWERQRHGRIGHDAYEALGRVHDALVTHAEQIWTGALTEAEQRAARALLVQLVHPGDTAAAPTRRTLARSDLRPEQWRLAQRLMTTRLVVPGEDYRPGAGGPPEETVELAHETLLTHWTRLRTYYEEDREFRIWQEGLRRRIIQWSADPRPGRRLLRGQDLRDARAWRAERGPELRPTEEQFIEASGRGARRRLTGLTAVGVVLALLAGGGAWAWRADAEQESAAKAAEVLLHQSREAETVGTDRGMSYTSLLLALRAYRTRNTEQTRTRLREMHSRYGFADLLAPHYPAATQLTLDLAPPSAALVDPGGKTVAALTGEGKLVGLRADGQGVHRVRTGQEVGATAVSPDGARIAFGGVGPLPTPSEMTAGPMSAEDAAKLLDPQRHAARLLDVATGRITDLEAPPPGDRLDPGSEVIPGLDPSDLGLDLPDLPDLPDLSDLPGAPTPPTQYARFSFSPDSKVLLAQTGLFGQGGRLVLWDAETGRIKKILPGLPEAVSRLWLRDGGEHLLTLTDRRSSVRESALVVQSWDLTGTAPVARELLTRPNGEQTVHMDVNTDLTRLALIATKADITTPSLTHHIQVYDLSDGRLLRDEQNAQLQNPDGITVGAGGATVLPYTFSKPLPPDAAPPGTTSGEGPIRFLAGLGTDRGTWSVDLIGPAERPAAILQAMGILALLRPGDGGGGEEGDVVRRLTTAPAAAPGGAPSRDDARRWMDRFCRILMDETLPPAAAGKLPPGSYRGKLCEGGNGRRG
ncbi:trypsin-like peptidase domain-containing protein [Streptomyces toxytricini]|uniref:Trypsin-like peptidase domain-containing protein n=1 Tax=Streptomyces toxytricini TaxID=67369 RepID=A0ABW8EUF5_STRT5